MQKDASLAVKDSRYRAEPPLLGSAFVLLLVSDDEKKGGRVSPKEGSLANRDFIEIFEEREGLKS
jgi:hypothetical protein